MTSITQDMKHRLLLIKYAEKYDIAKADVKYKTNKYIYRWKRRYDGYYRIVSRSFSEVSSSSQPAHHR